MNSIHQSHYMKHLQRKTPCDNIKDKIENIVEKKVDELVKEKLQDLVDKGEIEIKNTNLISNNQNGNTGDTEMEITGNKNDTKDNSDTVKTFSKQLSMHIAASNPLALESNSIDQSIIEKEQELVAEELKNSGKPDDIAKKISVGKMNKFKEENALLTQAWVMEPKKKVQEVLKELSIADLKIKEFYRIKIGE